MLSMWFVGFTLVFLSPVHNSAIQLAFISDPSNELSASLGDINLHRQNDSTNQTQFEVFKFEQFEYFLNETSTECPFSVVIAMVTCAENVRLYQHLRSSCPGSMLFTLFESTCQRPPNDIGIGIPHLNTLNNVIPLLTDIGIAFSDRWPQVTVLYDTELDIFQLGQFVDMLKSVSEQSQVEEYRLNEESVHTRTLSLPNLQILKAHKVDNRKRLFLAIVNRVMFEKVILASKELSLINFVNKWVFILTERSSINLMSDQVKDIISESDILLVQNVRDQECLALKLDCIIDLVEDVLRKAVHEVQTNLNYNFGGNKRQTKNRLLSETKLLLAHGNSTKFLCGNCDHYEVESLVKHRINDIVDPKKGIVQVNPGNIKFKMVTQMEGAWSPFKGFLLKNDQNSETNLKNRPLNIGIVDQPPMIRIYKNGVYGNSSQEIVGTTYEMVLVLAAKLNFTPTFVVDYSSNMGYLQSDGSWTGMIKRVVNGEVDIGANGYWKTYDRLKAVYFTFPFNLKEISMLVKKTDEDHKYLFLAPFTWDAWLSILATVLLMGPFLWLVHRSSRYYEYYQMRDGKGLFKLGNCVWYCFGAIVQQGGDYLPMAISGRILITFWWLFVIVTVTTYSGNLVALLTFPKIFNPINDLNDLIDFKHLLKYGATRTSGIEELIKDSENMALKMLADNIVYFDSVDADNLFDEVKQMRMVFLSTDTEIRYLISEDFKKYNNCQLMIAKEPILTKSVSFVIGNDKPLGFKEKIDYEVGRMAKSGLVTLWNKKYEVKGNDCLFPLLVRAGDVKKIELSHMVDCFFVLGLGVIVGVFSLFVEVCKRRKRVDGNKIGFPKLVNLMSVSTFWQKLAKVYGKIKNGQLYDSWLEKHKSNGDLTKANLPHNQARPIYHNYFTYNSNRGKQLDWSPYMQRGQRSQYWQNGLGQNGTVSTNNNRHPLWNNGNRF